MPRRRLIAAATLAALTCAAPAQGQTGGATPTGAVTTPSADPVYTAGQSDRLLLDGEWLYRPDPRNEGLGAHYERSTSTAGWSAVTIPHAWNAGDYSDASARGTIGWYRKDFRRPSASDTTSWVLRFESVNYRATVYLNGRRIGSHESAFIPFEIPVSALKPGVNRLVLRVDNHRRATDIPPIVNQSSGRPGGGWWNYGGILREVYLRRVNAIDIENLLARPTLRCARCEAKVLIRARLRNATKRRQRVRLTATVGTTKARFKPTTVKPARTKTAKATVTIRRPHLWEPGDPHLYHVRAKALANGQAAAQYDTDIGIRQIRVSKGRMLLNGKPVQLRGASMHEDSLDRGGALSPEQIEENIGLLRDLGATVTRAHYPLHPLTLQECDRLGIMVWEQIPFNRGRFDAGTTETQNDAAARSQAVRRKALAYLEQTISRDQNHPSVFSWSVTNEPQDPPGAAERDYAAKAIRLVHRMDPTRLAAIDLAGYPTTPQSDEYARFDAIGINSYFGWYPGPNGTLEDREGLAPFLAQAHHYYPRTALFVTEFGAESNRAGPVDEKGSYSFQRDLLAYHLDQYDASPYVNGAIVWILKDFAAQPGWDGGDPKPFPPFNQKGLVDSLGRRKPAFEEMASRFRDTPPFR